MPNHIMNRVTFLGRKENVEKAIELMGPDFDLNKIAEEPEDLSKEVRQAAVEAARDYIENHSDEDLESYADRTLNVYPRNVATYPENVIADGVVEDFRRCVGNKRKYGYYWWYEWRMKNWGCKWNTYEHGDFGVFLTANSPCREAYRRISERFGITVKVLFADEDRGFNCGIITTKNGYLTEWNPEPGSGRAKEFADSVWNS